VRCSAHVTLHPFDARGLEQETDSPLGIVDPVLDQARRCDVAMLFAKPMDLAQVGDQLSIVIAQIRQHIGRRYKIGIVVTRSTLAS
jgi:hypothetical protein